MMSTRMSGSNKNSRQFCAQKPRAGKIRLMVYPYDHRYGMAGLSAWSLFCSAINLTDLIEVFDMDHVVTVPEPQAGSDLHLGQDYESSLRGERLEVL